MFQRITRPGKIVDSDLSGILISMMLKMLLMPWMEEDLMAKNSVFSTRGMTVLTGIITEVVAGLIEDPDLVTAEDVPARGQVAGGHAARADAGPAQSPEMTAVATSQNPDLNLRMTVAAAARSPRTRTAAVDGRPAKTNAPEAEAKILMIKTKWRIFQTADFYIQCTLWRTPVHKSSCTHCTL